MGEVTPLVFSSKMVPAWTQVVLSEFIGSIFIREQIEFEFPRVGNDLGECAHPQNFSYIQRGRIFSRMAKKRHLLDMYTTLFFFRMAR